jgi:hypothetical protein
MYNDGAIPAMATTLSLGAAYSRYLGESFVVHAAAVRTSNG